MDFLDLHCLTPNRRTHVAMRSSGAPSSVTYEGLEAAVEMLSAVFEKAGVGPGARVALLTSVSIECVVGLLAALRSGAAVAPIDASLRGLSLTAAFERLAPDAVLGGAETLRRLAECVGGIRVMVTFGEFVGGAVPSLATTARIGSETRDFLLPLVAVAPRAQSAKLDHRRHVEDDALLIATSGSTGEPKFVRLSHQATLFNIRRHLSSLGLAGPFRALQVLDLNYSYGVVASLLATLVAGGTLVLPMRSDASGIRAALAAECPTVCLGSPALFAYLIDTCPFEERAAFDCLDTIGIGGDRCREPLRRKIAAFLPHTRAYVTYGATEAGPRITTLAAGQFLARPNSVGLPIEGVEIAILDAEGRPCVAGETGALHVRTPSRMSGYLGQRGSGSSAQDWLAIGDLASRDEDGFLTIEGRADRQFKHRGRRVNPAQIEAILERFPGVVAARVEPGGEEDGPLRAVVHHDSAEDALVEKLREHCRRNLPNRLVPGEIVTVVERAGYFFKGRRLPFVERMT